MIPLPPKKKEEMKAWQHGLPIAKLRALEADYSYYNSFALGPFAKFKKNNIAEAIHLGEWVHRDGVTCTIKKSKVSSPITMYEGTNIGMKQPSDVTIQRLRGEPDAIKRMLAGIDGPAWVYHWIEDQSLSFEGTGFEYVGSKITTFSELVGVYFKNGNSGSLFNEAREHPQLDAADLVTLKKVSTFNPSKILSKLKAASLSYENHYSNYNSGDAWSALALRGYSKDPQMIAKPSEMNDKWKAKHEGEDFHLQNTSLYCRFFPEVEQVLSFLDGEIHRIRLMRLTPGGGELQRHTDQVDKDSGGRLGQLARLHFPLVTNAQVKFRAWEPNGNMIEVNPKVGEIWFLDTRKPHMVLNEGATDRIHLVVDCEVTPNLHALITQ
jgi:hypothetical protein